MLMPTTPQPDPCDHRTQSAPVVIQTVRGEWYTARWTVYADQDEDGIPPCWELVGRDGLQLDRDEVVQWFPPAAVVDLVGFAEGMRELLMQDDAPVWAAGALDQVSSILARVHGGQ